MDQEAPTSSASGKEEIADLERFAAQPPRQYPSSNSRVFPTAMPPSPSLFQGPSKTGADPEVLRRLLAMNNPMTRPSAPLIPPELMAEMAQRRTAIFKTVIVAALVGLGIGMGLGWVSHSWIYPVAGVALGGAVAMKKKSALPDLTEDEVEIAKQ